MCIDAVLVTAETCLAMTCPVSVREFATNLPPRGLGDPTGRYQVLSGRRSFCLLTQGAIGLYWSRRGT